MAPNFKSGKGQKVLFNNVDLSQILTSVTVSASVEAYDTTVFGNSDRTKIAGLRDGTVAYEGLFDGTALSTGSTASTGALDAKFETALAASTQPIVTYGPEGDTLGSRARLWRQETNEYVAGSPVNDVVKVSAGGVMSTRQDYGVWLHALAARTSTSSTFTSWDSGYDAGTTGGAVAHLHVTADSTLTSVVVKVQHSSAASASTASWADLITFTSFDESTAALAAQRSAVTTSPVKRRTRVIISTFTGGTAKSATFAVAFARRGLQR
jgi:hypothetical protein